MNVDKRKKRRKKIGVGCKQFSTRNSEKYLGHVTTILSCHTSYNAARFTSTYRSHLLSWKALYYLVHMLSVVDPMIELRFLPSNHSGQYSKQEVD